MKLPEKFCIIRNRENHEEVNKLFAKLTGRKYCGKGECIVAGIQRDYDFMHYPPMTDDYHNRGKVVSKRRYHKHQLITLEEYQNMTKFRTQLPKIWYCTVRDELSYEKLGDWVFISGSPSDFNLGSIVGKSKLSYEADPNGSEDLKSWNPNYYDGWGGEEISFDEFRFLVLKEYTTEDWLEGRIAIERPSYSRDYLLDSFMRSCNKDNLGVTPDASLYLICNGFGRWTSTTKLYLGGRPIVKDVKTLLTNDITYMMSGKKITKNENKLVGYRVKDKFFLTAVSLYNQKVLNWGQSYWENSFKKRNVHFLSDSYMKEYFEEMGLLDIWFDKVYEDGIITLPAIKGGDGVIYTGSIEGNNIKYGCALLPIAWFTASENRHIKTLSTNNNVTISESEMVAIRKYLRHKSFVT